MAKITLKGNAIETSGDLPKVGAVAPAISLVKTNLSEVDLASYAGKRKVLNIFPSVDTGTCATSVRTFNKAAAELADTVVLNISYDLPFALARFCGAEGIENAEAASCFRSTFAQDYGLQVITGPLKGLCSRAVVVLGADDTVLYTEQVAEITSEPNYTAALAAL